jgi:hypothetical protein
MQAVRIGSAQDRVLQTIIEQGGGGLPLEVGSYQDLLTQPHILELVAQNILYSKYHYLIVYYCDFFKILIVSWKFLIGVRVLIVTFPEKRTVICTM